MTSEFFNVQTKGPTLRERRAKDSLFRVKLFFLSGGVQGNLSLFE
jgi:hypothetical protein